MNLALLVTRTNIEDLAHTANAISEHQDDVVNGALSVIHDQSIPADKIEEAFLPLSRKFKAVQNNAVHVNASASSSDQISLLFGMFLMQVYSRFPDGWLIIDSKATPVVSDIMNAVKRQHNALGGDLTGRGEEGKGSIKPVGPLVIDMPQKTMKFLRYPVGQSWRERGQFQFARSKFKQVSVKDYLWNLGVGAVAPKIEEPVEATQEGGEITPEDQPFHTWDKELLIQYIHRHTGVKPHHATGYRKLVALAEKNTASV